MLIKTAFGITHDDIPFMPEDFEIHPIEDLVEETLEQKKEHFFTKLQQQEINKIRNEWQAYQKKDYFVEKLAELVGQHLVEFSKTYQGPNINIKDSQTNELMLEIPIVDLHLSKLSWKPETGENYDYKIARERFRAIITDIIASLKDQRFSRIIIPIGNDFFHFDTPSTTTSAGTPMDADLRWPKVYTVGVEMWVEAIDAIRQEFKCPIEAFLIPGNHDRFMSFVAVQYLYAWYKDVEHVIINPEPQTRKYIEFGNCLIGFTHGDKEKERIFGNMQVEVPKAWGRTKYREWHLAHLHSEEVNSKHGIKARRLTSVTGKDAWHYEKGYTGSLPQNQSFVWDKNKGLRYIFFTTIEI